MRTPRAARNERLETMSVRRLAPKELQPGSFAFTAENSPRQRADRPISAGREDSAVIPLLRRAHQEHGGGCRKRQFEHVGEVLDMPYIRVLEVATFYTMFLLAPVGKKAHVQVCGTTPCLCAVRTPCSRCARRRIHHEPLHLSADGNFAGKRSSVSAPASTPRWYDRKDTYEDLTAEARQGARRIHRRSPEAGPQNDLHFSAPIGGDHVTQPT